MVDIRSHILKHKHPCRFVNGITHRLLWCVGVREGALKGQLFLPRTLIQHRVIIIFTILLGGIDVL